MFVETNYQAEDEKNSTANHEPHPLLILQVGDESGQDHDDKDDYGHPFGVTDVEEKADVVVLVCEWMAGVRTGAEVSLTQGRWSHFLLNLI